MLFYLLLFENGYIILPDPVVYIFYHNHFTFHCQCYHGSRLGCETKGVSRSALQRALLVVILLTSIRGIKNFNKRNALCGVNLTTFMNVFLAYP